MTTPLKNIGRYKLLAELGRGSFAVVYHAFDTKLNCAMALKVLNPRF